MQQTGGFLGVLEGFYRANSRDLPWRRPEPDGSFDAYKILVSELMLQQTQVPRVIPKYVAFLAKFPTIQSLAAAPLAEVLIAWSGLGYNRRAKYLWQAAKNLLSSSSPWTHDALIACKGIGPNTAGAILAYSYNAPVLFLETNIKTVLIHHFYEDRAEISDKELLATLSKIVPWNSGSVMLPRDFYWALMDYGTHLKATAGNQTRRSKSYTRQSRFEGSVRQIRGQVLRQLGQGPMLLDDLHAAISDERLSSVLAALTGEELVTIQDKKIMLYNE